MRGRLSGVNACYLMSLWADPSLARMMSAFASWKLHATELKVCLRDHLSTTQKQVFLAKKNIPIISRKQTFCYVPGSWRNNKQELDPAVLQVAEAMRFPIAGGSTANFVSRWSLPEGCFRALLRCLAMQSSASLQSKAYCSQAAGSNKGAVILRLERSCLPASTI